MYVILLALFCIFAGLLAPKLFTLSPAQCRYAVAAGFGAAVSILLWSSCYVVMPGRVGHLQRIYFGAPLPPGNILARAGQNGHQIDVLEPGFHFKPLLRVIHEAEEFPVVSVPEGQFALLSAKDGVALNSGELLARPWPEGQLHKMLDAAYFLANGGQRGVQLTVLTPGQYVVNRYLFDVSLYPVLDVEAGFVAVIKSNINQLADCPGSRADKGATSPHTNSLVAKGCAGIWDAPLMPGIYNLHPVAYQATLIPTRAQSLVYSSSHAHKEIALVRDGLGRIMEQIPAGDESSSSELKGEAVSVTMQGQQAQLELRLTIKIDQEKAARLVAEVGDFRVLEREILSPAIRSSIRQAALESGRKLTELTSRRTEFEADIGRRLQKKIRVPGVTLESVYLITADMQALSAANDQGQVPSYELQARIVAVGIPGAAGVRQVGFFHPGGPMRNKPSFRTYTRPGQVLDPERVLVSSMSNYGAPLGIPGQSPGAVLSVNPTMPAPLVIPAYFAVDDGQQSTLNGDVQLFTAQSPAFLNLVNNPRAVTALEAAVSNPRYISINNAFGRPWFANAPSGWGGSGTSTVVDPSGEPLAQPPSHSAGGVFAGGVTNREADQNSFNQELFDQHSSEQHFHGHNTQGQYTQGDLLHGAVGTAFMGASPDGTGFAVFAVVKADGSVAQVHVHDGVDGLAPPGTVSAIGAFNSAANGNDDPGLVGVAFEWTPERILYIADGPRNRIAALHLVDDGKHFVVRKIRYILQSEFAGPVDLAAAMPEIANPKFASHTTLAGRSDLYVLNRANGTILRIDRNGKVLARAMLHIPGLARAEGGHVAGMAVSSDGRKIWITLQGVLPRFAHYPGALIEVSAFDREGPLADRPNYRVVEKLDTPGAKQGKALFLSTMDVAHGLGPLFNATSCATCHHYPNPGGMGVNEDTFVVRVAHFDHVSGRLDSLIDRGGPIARNYSIAQSGKKTSQMVGISRQANITSVRMAPSLFGMAEIDEIADESILAEAVNKGDGVYGRVNMVTDAQGEQRIGKYGWKADVAGLDGMVATALDNELGITNPIAENIRQHTYPGGGRPKLKLDDDGSIVNAIRDYLRALTLEPVTSP